MSLALCPQLVSRAPQHFRSSATQATHGGCFAHMSICSVVLKKERQIQRSSVLKKQPQAAQLATAVAARTLSIILSLVLSRTDHCNSLLECSSSDRDEQTTDHHLGTILAPPPSHHFHTSILRLYSHHQAILTPFSHCHPHTVSTLLC